MGLALVFAMLSAAANEAEQSARHTPPPEPPPAEGQAWWLRKRAYPPVDIGQPVEIAGTIADLMQAQHFRWQSMNLLCVPPRWVEAGFRPHSHFGRRFLADNRKDFALGFEPLLDALRQYDHLERSLTPSGLALPMVAATEREFPAYADGLLEHLLHLDDTGPCLTEGDEAARCFLTIRLLRTPTGEFDLHSIRVEDRDGKLLRWGNVEQLDDLRLKKGFSPKGPP